MDNNNYRQVYKKQIIEIFKKKMNECRISIEYKDLDTNKKISEKDIVIMKKNTSYDFNINVYPYKEIPNYMVYGISMDQEIKGILLENMNIIAYYNRIDY